MLKEILIEMGEVGRRLHQMGASEGGAGNISICLRERLDVSQLFPIEEQIQLPIETPHLAGMMIIATGSGCRLRDIHEDPTANLGCLVVHDGGQTGQLFTAHDRGFKRLTSEINSHLIVHNHEMGKGTSEIHAVVHAQPLHTTYLSHIERYQNEDYFNRHLLRWQPETIIQFPQGFGMTRYEVPGTNAIALTTLAAMKTHTLVIWARHGVIARSDSLMQAYDRIEYAEAAAHYEYLNLTLGEPSSGLSNEEILGICKTYNIVQSMF